MFITKRTTLFCFAVLLLAGCSTIQVHSTQSGGLHPYIGTKQAFKGFANSFIDYDYYGQPFLMAVDIPLCLVADTLVLPYDVAVYLKRLNRRER